MLGLVQLLARAQTVILVLVLSVALAGSSSRRIGDNLQIALPALAWACAGANRAGDEFALRLVSMLVGVHATKRLLDEAAMNQRPSGGRHGFPSGHTAAAAFGASALLHDCLRDRPRLQAAVVMAAGFVGASRIQAGKHDIWQVAAGALWGWGCDRALRRGPQRERLRNRLQALRRRAGAAAARGWVLARGRLRQLGLATGAAAALALSPSARPAAAQDLELSVYLGAQTAPHSVVRGSDPVLGDFSARVEWEGRSFENPPYYGLRAMWWRPSGWGFGIEANHAKVYSTAESRPEGLSTLEFTDGINILTVNAFRRFAPVGRFTPYLGAGVGLAVPHVEVTTPAGRTFEYQVTGPAVIWVAGASLPLSDRWDIFGEYKGSYSQNEADLNGGGRLETDLVTNAINIGLTYRF